MSYQQQNYSQPVTNGYNNPIYNQDNQGYGGVQSDIGGGTGFMGESEEYEDEMSMAGRTRQSDGVMRTPGLRSYTSMQPQLDPIMQKQAQPGMPQYKPQQRGDGGTLQPNNPLLKDPTTHCQFFNMPQRSQAQEDKPMDVKMPRMIEAHKAQSAQELKPFDQNSIDMKAIRNKKEHVPSFLPNEDKYQKFQNILQEDEIELKQRINKQRNLGEADGEDTGNFQVTRKTIRSKEAPYSDPFKEHMQKMEDKLKYGQTGSVTASPRGGGLADPVNRRNQAFQSVQRQRDIQSVPTESQGNTLSLPMIRTLVDTMESRMEREIDREEKLRRDAKKLIINAVRKEPELDRNVKAWLKTERDESKKPLIEGQVYTRQYRKLIYQEIRTDRAFPLMHQLMNQGVVQADPYAINSNPLTQAKMKYKRASEHRVLEAQFIAKPQFEYDKVKKVYNASLLETELLDPVGYLLKKKQDAKTCIMHVFKRKYEEKQLHAQLTDPKTLRKEKAALEEKLKVIKTALELARQRLEWVLFDTPFTIAQLEQEINAAKTNEESRYENEQEKLILKQFLKEHKINQGNYEETQLRAREARNILGVQVLEARALKNRTGCDSIADFVLMFRELQHMQRLDTAKVLLQDALLSKKKTEEFFEFIVTIIKHEDEMVRLRKEYAEEKLLAGKDADDQGFVNYDELVLQKIDLANKEDFARQFKQDKLIFPFVPFWFTPLNGYDKQFSDILRQMLKLKITEARVLCEFLGCNSLHELTTFLRHNKQNKEFILFDKEDLTFLRREHGMDEQVLKGFANVISIISKEFLMVPQKMIELAKPSNITEVNLSDFKGEHLTPDAISAVIACIQNYQSNVKKLIFRNCSIDSKGAQLFKLLLSDERRPIIMCDFDGNTLGDPGIDQIMAGLKNNPKGDLKILKLADNKLSITAAIRLAHMLKKRSEKLPPVNLQVLKLSHNAIGNIGCETLVGYLKLNDTLRLLDLSFNQIGDRGLLAVAESFKENQRLEVLNLLGNEFTDKSLKYLTEALAMNKKSKLAILKLGTITSDSEQFERFLNHGFLQSAVLKYLYLTTNQYQHPAVKKIQDNEGDNPKTLTITESYDEKLDSQLVLELMSQIAEVDPFRSGNGGEELFAFGEKILNDVIKDKYGLSNLEVLIYLFEYIFPPDHILSDNISPMHLFAKFGSLEAMYYCLRLKVSPNFKTSIAYTEYPSATPLHIAAGYSQLEMCKFLLTHNQTDVNCKDLNGNTPLHYSALAGSSQLAQLLIEHGANALALNKKKMLPLHSCIFSDHVVCFKVLVIETDKQKAKAFLGKQVEMAIDMKTYQGFTPLMLALEEKADSIFNYLVQNGADLKAQDEEGNTILHRSIMNQNAKYAKYLIKQGADIFQRTFAGESAIMMAVRFGLADVVRMLALKGADLFEKNFKGDSLLHLAARMDQAEVIGYLLDKGLQTIDMNRDGQRPADLAVRPAIRQLLLLENPKSHDLFSNQVTYGTKLQDRIKVDQLGKNTGETEDELRRKKVEQEKNGRLLNEAIIKYRIEKRDIVDTANKSKFSAFAGNSQMSAEQDPADRTRFLQGQTTFNDRVGADDEDMYGNEDGASSGGKIRRPEVDFGEDAEEEDEVMSLQKNPARQTNGRMKDHSKGLLSGGQNSGVPMKPMPTQQSAGFKGTMDVNKALHNNLINKASMSPGFVPSPGISQAIPGESQNLSQSQAAFSNPKMNANSKNNIQTNYQE